MVSRPTVRLSIASRDWIFCFSIASRSRSIYFSVCAMTTSACEAVPEAYRASAASSILTNSEARSLTRSRFR